jgi:hypothetical protein
MDKNAVRITLGTSLTIHWLNREKDCGDITDVTSNNGVFGADSECQTTCPGDPIHICGDGNRLTTYYWNGVMNNWRTPANIGRYEVGE